MDKDAMKRADQELLAGTGVDGYIHEAEPAWRWSSTFAARRREEGSVSLGTRD